MFPLSPDGGPWQASLGLGSEEEPEGGASGAQGGPKGDPACWSLGKSSVGQRGGVGGGDGKRGGPEHRVTVSGGKELVSLEYDNSLKTSMAGA